METDEPLFDREAFLAWRSPRRGSANPELMTNPVWQWLVMTRLRAWEANNRFDGPDASRVGPGWCFDRFGCSVTRLPDGRVLRIAGEHEDSYDADFYIYNDVLVRHPDGAVEILGYPEAVFPPTDFHSATLCGDRVLVVGNTGYQEHRCPGQTPVFALDIAGLRITHVPTFGEGPSWLSGHAARLSDDGERLQFVGGRVLTPDGEFVENYTDWALELATGRWLRLRDHAFELWSVAREDEGDLMLFDMSCADFAASEPDLCADDDSLELLQEAGVTFDCASYAALFVPEGVGVPWEPESQFSDDEGPDVECPRPGVRPSPTAGLKVGQVLVRYFDERRCAKIWIEGDPEPDLGHRLAEDLARKLEAMHGVRCVARRVRLQH